MKEAGVFTRCFETLKWLLGLMDVDRLASGKWAVAGTWFSGMGGLASVSLPSPATGELAQGQSHPLILNVGLRMGFAP